MIHIAEETLTPALIDEARQLLLLNWITSGSFDAELPLDPDYSVYLRLARTGALLVVTLRVDGELNGYAVLTVGMSRHHRTVKVACGEALYVVPACRRHAVALLRATIEYLRHRQVQRVGWFIVPGHPVHRFLKRMEFSEDEVMLERVL
jgi:GNAT superfamily N-acetyltransferase